MNEFRLRPVTGVVRPPRRKHVLFEPPRQVFERLGEEPGEWFLVGSGPVSQRRGLNTAAHALRSGRYRGIPAGAVEATVVTTGDVVQMFARKVV